MAETVAPYDDGDAAAGVRAYTDAAGGLVPAGVAAFVAAGVARPVTAADPLPVLRGVTAGPLTDRSGTITAGGAAQQVAAANTSRKYLLIQNLSGADLWVNFGTAAVASQPSLRLPPGWSLVMRDYVDTQAVSVVGAATGQAYTAKEG